MKERWKDIEGYEGLYQVSNRGKIYSFKSKRCLKGQITIWGYKQVELTNNNIISSLSIHRLVAQAFIPNPENKPEVNHKNGIKTDNRVENLEWVTSKENKIHAVEIGNIKTIPVKAFLPDGKTLIFRSQHEAARQLNVRANSICEILSGKFKKTKGIHFKRL